MRDKFWKRYQMAEERNSKGKEKGCYYGNRVQLSEADTFIEFCFERKCEQMKNGMEVLDEWRYHKNQYSKIMDTTVYDFQHFSRHDASHSISILEAVELVVGEKRIVSLSRGDLWLLLEAAYSHDLGMALTGEEMSELWSKKEFQDYILDCLNRTGVDQQKAAGYYKQMDNLLHHKAQIEEMEGSEIEPVSFAECWPAEIANYVHWLVCGYIRRQHGERNQRIRKRIITLEDSVIPQRLYECVVKIAALHTEEDYNKIFEKLPREEKGIGAETVYPRFAAAMLRLGDVLDTDNNRFSAYALEHMVEVPPDSLLHVGKHKAIDSIQISMKKIKVTAVSDDLEVCKEASQWMRNIDNEVEKLICNWNRMVPHKLSGCVLRPSECRVYYNSGTNEEYQTNSERHFEVNKQELIKLLIGSNIYDTKLDFIREYLQNAMDASKMQFWQDIQAGDYDEYLIYGRDKKTITPFDFPKEVYEKYKIRLSAELPLEEGDYDNACIIIEDSGIGMEKECVDIVSNLGSGWKKRERYGKYIPQMPKWLTPTGGFGIGIQSAFMVTDRVEVKTKTRDESKGRRIVLETPDAGGLVTQNDCDLHHNGTIVKVKIPLNLFLKEKYILQSKDKEYSFELESQEYYENDNGIFSEELVLNHILDVIKKYINFVMPNSILPVSVGAKGFKSEEINGRCWREIGETIEWNGKKYLILEIKGKRVRIWDYERQIYFEAEWTGNIHEKCEQIACYKNVRCTHQSVTNKQMYAGFDMFIDILGFSAKKVLKIHRNEFKEEFKCDCYVDEYMKLYLHIYDLAVHDKIVADVLVSAVRKDLHFLMMRIILMEASELRMDELLLDDTQKNLPITRTKLVIDYKNQDDEQQQQEQEGDAPTVGKILQDVQKVIDPKKVEFRYEQEQVTLHTFFEEYKKMFRKENPSGVILIEREDCKKVETALTVSSIQRWIEKNMELRKGVLVLKSDAKDKDSILMPLITIGYYEMGQELISEIMEKTQVSGQQFTVFAGYQYKELKRGITKITSTKQTELTREGEKNFYQKSFGDGIDGQAVFSADCYTERYKELYVSYIPYGVKGDLKPPYLISPITNIERVAIGGKNRTTNYTTGYELNLDAFIKLVTDTESFRFLVAWVVNNAEDKAYQGNAVLVEERYKEYLREMYIMLGEKFGRDKK